MQTRYLTILLCTYNRAKLLNSLIDELINQIAKQGRNDLEILLIDNNSTDETKEIVLDCQKNCNFLTYHFEPRQGLAISRNTGLSMVQGKVIAFIDDDIKLDQNWLKEILISLEGFPYKAFGGKIIPLWEKEKPTYINLDGFFSLNQKMFPAHDNGDLQRLYPINKEEVNPVGANMWIYKELFEKYGKFREDLGRVGFGGIPCEDTEFCSRLLKNNEQIFYYPKAVVFHPISSYRMSKEFIRSWHYRNGISSVRKGGRVFPYLDFLRLFIRFFVYIPFYLCFYFLGIFLASKKINYWAEFNFIRILGQLREFLRIWFKIPLKDPTF